MSGSSSPFHTHSTSADPRGLADDTRDEAFDDAFDVPEPLGLRLDDVDLFLDLPETAPGRDSDVVMSDSEFPEHIPLPPAQRSPPTLPLNVSDSDSDYYYRSDADDDEPRSRRRVKTEAKPGSSWARQKRLKTKSQEPTFVPNESPLNRFRAKVLQDDLKAEFDEHNVSRVRCSNCATWVLMRALYDMRRWTEHRATPKCKKARKAGFSTQSLLSLGFKKVTAAAPGLVVIPPAPESRLLPCPGLTRGSNEGIATYMARTTASGGGAPSRARIARELFASDEIEWRDLDPSEQRMVLRREVSLQKWKVGRSVGAIFSSDCLRDVSTPDGDDPDPCSACRKLLKLHTFQVAIRRPLPDENKMKYVPVAHRDPELGRNFLKYH